MNEEFLNRNRGKPAHVQAAVRARRVISPENSAEDHKELLTILEADSASLDDAISGLKLLKEWQTSLDIIDTYAQKAGKRWPKATVFQRRA